ncbi:hypothetical protein CI102_13315 [Trichoderma harzianum]|nr:hypothetical protein CI102_13315 [Trichoderma harzianum]
MSPQREEMASPADDSRPRSKIQRRAHSCLPCRLHKLRCSRGLPCQNCYRYRREEQCRLNPPPQIISRPRAHQIRPVSYGQRMQPRPAPESSSSSVTNDAPQPDLPPTPSSDVIMAKGSTRIYGEYPSEVNLSGASPHLLHLRDTQVSRDEAAGPAARIPLLPRWPEGKMTASATVFSRPVDLSEVCLFDEPASYWRWYLVSLLPSQAQCDMLVSYFFENINWMYQSIHAPSFRSEMTAFWDTEVDDVDLIWLALLYIILCLGAFFAPSSVAEAVGFEETDLPKLHRRWYAASRQALQAGGHDVKPTFLAVQVFIVSQTYWYCTKNVEALNSHMGQTVRNAQALGLDKEAPQSITSCVGRELRHRLWWDLVSSDTFQALCLGRPALLQSHLSTVPFPANCNDVDLGPSTFRPRPMSEPTEMSIHCFRARLFKVLNKLCMEHGSQPLSYEFIVRVDAEITEIMDDYPWYLKGDPESVTETMHLSVAKVVPWMRHVLHSAVHLQRMRMYRPFLNPVVDDAWLRCVTAATSALAVYKSLRNADLARFRRAQKMHVHTYQVFSVSVALATFLLVEMPSNPDPIRADIELVLEDLSWHSSSFHDSRWIPLISDGSKVIRRILRLYDARCKRRQNGMTGATTGNGRSADNAASLQEEVPTSLVPAISSVFGGETMAQRYLERCSIEHIMNGPTPAESGSGTNWRVCGGLIELSGWDGLLDPVQSGQWNDAFWADMNACVSLDLEL